MGTFCELCGKKTQCASIGVCPHCVRTLQEGSANAGRVAQLEAALAEERSQLAMWRRAAQSSEQTIVELQANNEQLREENARLEAASAELIEAVEGMG